MFTGKLIKVKDGDTYVIDYKGVYLTVRLANVDCPERNTPFSNQVIKEVKELIEGKLINFEINKLDNRGRHVCNIYVDNQRLDELLVANGLAWHWEKYSTNMNLVHIEKQAFENKKGIWNPQITEQYYGMLWKKQKSF